MRIKTSVLWLALIAGLLVAGARLAADERPVEPKHDDAGRHDQIDSDRHEQQEHPHGDAEMTMGHHRHTHWVTPPANYVNARSTRWDDPLAIARGQQLYQTYCMVCHGTNGKGTGPAAKGLGHPPADLTNHFHRAPGDGDAYLFWRVSEGGQVEPFKSMKSAMPAFKTVLSADQRWDVLAYVHHQFHGGFKTTVSGEGNVVAAVPASKQIVVEHGLIRGFMGPMTMGYAVNPPTLIDGLKAGDHIRFTINVQNKVIVKIDKLKP